MKLPKLGSVRFRWSRAPGGTIRHASISRDALGWHLSLCVELGERPVAANSGEPVGMDRGAVVQAALCTGELVGCERYLRPSERERLRGLERRRERQRRGSSRQQATKRQIARLRAREARRRGDHTHSLTTRLTRERALIAIEVLSTRAMTHSARGTLREPGRGIAQKRGLNRAILNRGWAELERELQYKAGWYGAQIVPVPARDTSITSARCTTIDKRSRESQARFHCRHCGHQAHADVNAARVILARAREHLAGGLSVTARGDLQAKQAGSIKREPTRQQVAA